MYFFIFMISVTKINLSAHSQIVSIITPGLQQLEEIFNEGFWFQISSSQLSSSDPQDDVTQVLFLHRITESVSHPDLNTSCRIPPYFLEEFQVSYMFSINCLTILIDIAQKIVNFRITRLMCMEC